MSKRDFAKARAERRSDIAQTDRSIFGRDPLLPGQIEHNGFIFDTTGLVRVPANLDRQSWIEFGSFINRVEGSIQWLIGDWALLAEDKRDQWLAELGVEVLPEDDYSKYSMLMSATDYSYSSVTKFKSTCEAFPVGTRRQTLSYSHHLQVKGLDEEERNYWLDLAEEEELSVKELRQRIKSSLLPEKVDSIKAEELLSTAKNLKLTTIQNLIKAASEGDSDARTELLKKAREIKILADQLTQYAKQFQDE